MNILKIILIPILLLTSLSGDVKSFSSIQEALDTFIQALERRDKKSLEELLTLRYKEIVDMRDIDKDDIDKFLESYKESHRLSYYGANEIYLSVGQHNWNLPIPLVKHNNRWSFDINLGMDNIITKMIGMNELAVLKALQTMTYEELLESSLDEVYVFTKDEDKILARPVEYNKTGYMSFILTKEKSIFEADLKEEPYVFDTRFKEVNRYYLHNQ